MIKKHLKYKEIKKLVETKDPETGLYHTLDFIAEAVGLSKQRIHQIYGTMGNRNKGLTAHTKIKICKNEECGKEYTGHGNNFCSMACRVASPDPQERKYAKDIPKKKKDFTKEDWSVYNKDRHEAVREKHNARMRKNYEAVKADPERWAKHKKKQYEYMKKYSAKNREKINAQVRARYAKNPEKFKANNKAYLKRKKLREQNDK